MSRATQDTARVPTGFAYGGVTLCAPPFQGVRLPVILPISRSYYPAAAWTAAVWAPPRSLATTCGITFVLFSWGYLDVSVPPVRPILKDGTATACGGFPHSDISGSSLICSSPKLFAACHVLHRLLMPRHSPCALISLTCVEENSVPFPPPCGVAHFSPFPSPFIIDDTYNIWFSI